MSNFKKAKRGFFRANWQIRAPTLRLIDSQGKQIGVVSLSEARSLAQKQNLDLIEIVPGANPPVARLADYAKFKYEQKKKEKEERKKKKKGEKLKEIRLTPFIGQADLKTRIERAKKFAQEGDRLKIVVKFLGRQIIRKEFGYQLLEKIKEELKEFYQAKSEIKLIGKRLIMFMEPTKRVKNGQKNKEENSQVSRQPVQNH